MSCIEFSTNKVNRELSQSVALVKNHCYLKRWGRELTGLDSSGALLLREPKRIDRLHPESHTFVAGPTGVIHICAIRFFSSPPVPILG